MSWDYLQQSPVFWTAVATVLVAVAGAIGSIVAARAKARSEVQVAAMTADQKVQEAASGLWAKGLEAAERVIALHERTMAMQDQDIQQVLAELRGLRDQNTVMTASLISLRAENARLTEQAQLSAGEVRAMREEMNELEQHIQALTEVIRAAGLVVPARRRAVAAGATEAGK
jgi:predicted nuclease with TOPRIM domain